MTDTKSLKVMIMAGGTGGHVFPALAVAEVLRRGGTQVMWLGTARGIENRLVPAAGITLHLIRVEGVRGRGLPGLLKAPFLIVYAIAQAISILRREQPDVVLGFGGFASGPGGIAARLLGKPLVIHEQNAVAGTTNRLLARCATRVLSAFNGAFAQAQVVGNPVRESIAALSAPRERYGSRQVQKEKLHLLVLGGSLGAKAINELLPDALGQLPQDARPDVWHQTGKDHAEATIALYMQHQVNAKVEAFIDDMASAYAWADVIVCRAGALTVSELMAAGVAAVLIPLPSAIDDHQTHNAAILSDKGAGISLAQRDLTAAKLAALLLTNLNERGQLMIMAEKARQLALPSAATTVANICVEVAHG
jgi:UDP-N-acetylglucosamine--N-acetylmuramyl-(pentapeptide) pyrophosphoryl-undecaprenol N-acetylglucosamine transferase